jgi:dTDP-4-dehydrorhamnose reductase
MTRYLLVGAAGMLGRDLQKALSARDVTALSRSALDITDLAAVRAAVQGHDVILNAAAYTAVDEAESHERDAMRVNAHGVHNLAIAAAEERVALVHFSTDYVFDGSATVPYREDEKTHPISVYGRSKAEGERLALETNPDRTIIIRTSWLYGEHGGNFVKTMLRLGANGAAVSVVSDQRGQPTWTSDLAEQVVMLLDAGITHGVFHGTASGVATWFDFARAVFELGGLDPQKVVSTRSADFVRPAPRPGYSVLGHDAWRGTGVAPMREWKLALADAFARGAFA